MTRFFLRIRKNYEETQLFIPESRRENCEVVSRKEGRIILLTVLMASKTKEDFS